MLAIDLDDDNMITYYEICMHYILPKVEVICLDEMKLSFLANDSDGDEKISLEELIDADIGIEDPESVELFFNIIDMDNDGQVSYDEYETINEMDEETQIFEQLFKYLERGDENEKLGIEQFSVIMTLLTAITDHAPLTEAQMMTLFTNAAGTEGEADHKEILSFIREVLMMGVPAYINQYGY